MNKIYIILHNNMVMLFRAKTTVQLNLIEPKLPPSKQQAHNV